MDGTLTADGSLRRADRLKALWRGDSGVLLGLLLVAVFFGALIGPQFFRAANLELMAIQTVIVCVAALGMTMVIVSSGIDLSVGSVVSLATVVTAVLLRQGHLAMIHQELSLAPHLTVMENIGLGVEPARLGVIEWRRLRDAATDALTQLGHPEIRPDATVADLSPAGQQLV